MMQPRTANMTANASCRAALGRVSNAKASRSASLLNRSLRPVHRMPHKGNPRLSPCHGESHEGRIRSETYQEDLPLLQRLPVMEEPVIVCHPPACRSGCPTPNQLSLACLSRVVPEKNRRVSSFFSTPLSQKLSGQEHT